MMCGQLGSRAIADLVGAAPNSAGFSVVPPGADHRVEANGLLQYNVDVAVVPRVRRVL